MIPALMLVDPGDRGQEAWIGVNVPAIISEELFDKVQMPSKRHFTRQMTNTDADSWRADWGIQRLPRRKRQQAGCVSNKTRWTFA
jgi:hypothetical protein